MRVKNREGIKEFGFQLVLNALVFLFYSFDQNNPHLSIQELVFFLNYAAAAWIINYLLLPRLFYRKKYLQFALSVLVVITGVILLEELVLEKLYFPTTRGAGFPGVFFTLVQIMPVITILVGFKFAWDALRKQREVEELKSVVVESELQFLKSQINPHFLFNNLNNLYSYAIEQSPKTPEIILELSGFLRYMLYECTEKYVPLDQEIRQLENFVNLNQLQIEDRGQIGFTRENIRPGYRIAPLILIVFIENAFKHSMVSQSENIFIDICIRMTDAGRLTLRCKNSYQPRSNTESLSQGIGLENVKKRLQLLYPEAHQLDILKREDRFEVNLTMDLRKSS